MAGIDAIQLGKKQPVQFGNKGGKEQAGAFLAQVDISKDDFAKRGYVAPPGLTEGGSAFTQASIT